MNKFNGRLEIGDRPALVLIDLVRAYFEPGSPLLIPGGQVLDAAAELLDVARRHGVHVIHTRVEYTEPELEDLLFVKKVPALRVLQRGTGLEKFAVAVEPQDNEDVIVKKQASAFFGTRLDEILEEREIDSLVIAGVSASGCVRATTVDAIARNLGAFVVREGIGDRNTDVFESSVSDIEAKYGQLINVVEARRALQPR